MATTVAVRMPQMKMAFTDEEEFGVVPLLDAPPAAGSEPVLRDCFFGSGTYIPSPLFKRNPSVESTPDACEDNQLPSSRSPSYLRAPFCSDNSLPDSNCSNESSPSSSPPSSSQQWYAIGNDVFSNRTLTGTGSSSSTGNGSGGGAPSLSCPGAAAAAAGQWIAGVGREEGWLEEWMDMNGIFDPSHEIACTEADIPSCCLLDQVTPELEASGAGAPQGANNVGLGALRSKRVSPASEGPSSVGESRSGWNASLNGAAVARGCRETERKSPAKNYVLRPLSKLQHVELEGSPILEHQCPRSAKVIKASSVVGKQGAFAETSERRKRSSPFISDKKREQNRSAAIRYRDKRRVEAKRMKEELHDLELRNVALKTTVSGLSAEIVYLKGILHEVIGS